MSVSVLGVPDMKLLSTWPGMQDARSLQKVKTTGWNLVSDKVSLFVAKISDRQYWCLLVLHALRTITNCILGKQMKAKALYDISRKLWLDTDTSLFTATFKNVTTFILSRSRWKINELKNFEMLKVVREKKAYKFHRKQRWRFYVYMS
jgi:hypothetical protein